MRLLLRCDLFRVVQDKDKNLTPANRYGAMVTIATYAILCILLLGEFADYFRGHHQCTLAPGSKFADMTPMEVAEMRQLSMVATFPYIPCSHLKHEMLSAEWREPDGIAGSVRLKRYATPSGSFARPPEGALVYADGQIDAEEMGCTISIKMPLPTTPVSFNIIVNGFERSQASRFRSDHTIHQFRLGGKDISGLVPQVSMDTTEPLSHSERALHDAHAQPHFYLFYVQYLRTQIILPNSPPVFGFQQTAEESFVPLRGDGTAPGIYMRLLPSPYSVRCTREYDTLSHFLINLCAVIGGVYTAASFLELAIETVAKRRRQHERAYQNALNTEKAEKQKIVDQYVRTM